MPRLFVAIDLPELLKQTLTALPAQFDGARWEPAEKVHLTLRFIGDVDTESATAIHWALNEVKAPALALQIIGVGQFPPNPRKPPRVLWAGVTNPPALLSLYEAVEAALRALGLPSDDRQFAPHITLARIKSDAGRTTEAAQRYLDANADLRSAVFPVTAFHLIESTLGTGGSRYRTLADYPLRD